MPLSHEYVYPPDPKTVKSIDPSQSPLHVSSVIDVDVVGLAQTFTSSVVFTVQFPSLIVRVTVNVPAVL